MRFRQLLILCGLGISVLSPSVAIAQKYPSRPVRIVVGFAPGGATDIAARAVAQKLTERMGGSFIVDNRPGASGNIAADIVAKSVPDGYTMLMANATIAIPSLYAKLPFDVTRDLAPLSLVAIGPSVLAVHPSLPVRDVKGLIALARARPNELSFGSGGVGNSTHLAMELFTHMAGIRMVHVPYKGGGPSVVGLVTGEVQVVFTSVPSALTHIRTGKMRALGVSISRRSKALPDVPSIAEAGLPGYYAASWYGLLLPAGVPGEIVNSVAQAVSIVMQEPDIQDKMLKQGFEPIGSNPEEFAKFVRDEMPRWAEIVKIAGIKPQ
jgi:tripartite-type tricarboxylate transporter receptor subunit TctC